MYLLTINRGCSYYYERVSPPTIEPHSCLSRYLFGLFDLSCLLKVWLQFIIPPCSNGTLANLGKVVAIIGRTNLCTDST